MVTEWFVPVRISRIEQENLFKAYRVAWTPTVAIIGPDGKEHFRFTGFMPPEELCARLILDGAKTELNLENYDLAEKCLRDVIVKYQGTHAVPEAVFYEGVVRFVRSHEPKALRETVDVLTKDFPQSEWTLRAKPYELIEM